MNFTPAQWRLIKHSPAQGAWNMAVDEAILEAVGQARVPATLRLYAWQPACLSLGYAQPYADVNQAALREKGWELVRRPTGGRAILHIDELTYSVIGPADEPRLAGSVLESYRVIAGALLLALHRLSIPAEAHEKTGQPTSSTANRDQNPVCFEVPSSYEITSGGKKLLGSAQARRKEGVLQHGSLPLQGDLERVLWALSFSDDTAFQEAVRRLSSRAITAESALGRPPSWDEAAQAFVEAFSSSLSLDFFTSDLTPEESQRATELAKDKYSSPGWTFRI